MPTSDTLPITLNPTQRALFQGRRLTTLSWICVDTLAFSPHPNTIRSSRSCKFILFSVQRREKKYNIWLFSGPANTQKKSNKPVSPVEVLSGCFLHPSYGLPDDASFTTLSPFFAFRHLVAKYFGPWPTTVFLRVKGRGRGDPSWWNGVPLFWSWTPRDEWRLCHLRTASSSCQCSSSAWQTSPPLFA